MDDFTYEWYQPLSSVWTQVAAVNAFCVGDLSEICLFTDDFAEAYANGRA